MKRITVFFLAVFMLPVFASAQQTSFTKSGGVSIQPAEIKGDTVITLVLDPENNTIVPGKITEYSIANYKNIDYQKTNPFQLESAGLHPEVYISNTNQGVIIISSAEWNESLKDFNSNLMLNTSYYETFTHHDTTIFSPRDNPEITFDFTKAAFISQDYKNAFNYTADPRTGISWTKSARRENLGSGYGQLLYDLIIVLPKK